MIQSLLLLFVFAAPPSRQATMGKEMCVKLLRPPRIALLLTAMLMLVLAAGSCQGQTAADKQRQSAMALEQQGQNAEAEIAWRTFLKAEPGSSEAYAHLGFLEAQQKRYKEAVPLYRKALVLDPDMPGLRLNLGLSLFKGGELNEAVQTFVPLLNSQPPSSADAQRLTLLIGMGYYGQGKFAEAVPYLKKATALDSQNLPFRLVLAHSCLGSKQYQCVLDVYHEILTLNAESAEADMLAGEALDEMKDHFGATQQFRAAVKANPKEPNVHFGLGYLLWSQNQYEEAAQEFQAELANDPNDAGAIAYLADTDRQMNHPEAARPLLEQAIRIAPGMELPHLDLGILDADAGHHDDALRELKMAAKLSPNNVDVHWRLARLYKAMGRNEEANLEFRKTSSLHKAAQTTILEQLDRARAKGESAEKAEDPASDK
jgi:tetratricopeptide (TPR) repeat protein